MCTLNCDAFVHVYGLKKEVLKRKHNKAHVVKCVKPLECVDRAVCACVGVFINVDVFKNECLIRGLGACAG